MRDLLLISSSNVAATNLINKILKLKIHNKSIDLTVKVEFKFQKLWLLQIMIKAIPSNNNSKFLKTKTELILRIYSKETTKKCTTVFRKPSLF